MKVKLIEMTKLCLFLSLLAVSSNPLWAQTSVNQLDNISSKNDVIFNSLITTTYSTNLNKPDSVNFSNSMDLDAELAAIYKGIRFSLSTGMTKNLTGERRTLLNNASLGAVKNLYSFNKNWSILGSSRLVIPLSEAARDFQKQITGVSVATPIVWRNSSWRISYGPSVVTNFHQTQTALNGTSNFQYILGQSLSILHFKSNGFYAMANSSYSRLISYQGNTLDNYRFTQLVGYSIGMYDFAVGHVMGGSPLAPNGVETDIRFFDSRDSTLFGMLTVLF